MDRFLEIFCKIEGIESPEEERRRQIEETAKKYEESIQEPSYSSKGGPITIEDIQDAYDTILNGSTYHNIQYIYAPVQYSDSSMSNMWNDIISYNEDE